MLFLEHLLCARHPSRSFDTLPRLILTSIRCHETQLASIRQMSRQVSRGSAGEYQADDQAGVAGLSWRVSGR